MPLEISVVVPACDSEALLRGCLESILNQDLPSDRFEVIVVDNGSRDRTARIAADFPVKTIHVSERNRARARNSGFFASRGELVAFVDAGTRLSRRWLGIMREAFDSPCIAACAGALRWVPPPNGRSCFHRALPLIRLSAGSQTDLLWDERSPIPVIDTAACVLRRSVLQEIGLFDDRLDRCEDSELSQRLVRSGHLVQSVPAAVAWEISKPLALPRWLLREWKVGRALAKYSRRHDSSRWRAGWAHLRDQSFMARAWRAGAALGRSDLRGWSGVLSADLARATGLLWGLPNRGAVPSEQTDRSLPWLSIALSGHQAPLGVAPGVIAFVTGERMRWINLKARRTLLLDPWESSVLMTLFNHRGDLGAASSALCREGAPAPDQIRADLEEFLKELETEGFLGAVGPQGASRWI